jgi:hypothetical protein
MVDSYPYNVPYELLSSQVELTNPKVELRDDYLSNKP